MNEYKSVKRLNHSKYSMKYVGFVFFSSHILVLGLIYIKLWKCLINILAKIITNIKNSLQNSILIQKKFVFVLIFCICVFVFLYVETTNNMRKFIGIKRTKKWWYNIKDVGVFFFNNSHTFNVRIVDNAKQTQVELDIRYFQRGVSLLQHLTASSYPFYSKQLFHR